MADEEKTPSTIPGKPERPIESTADDALGREGFVRRLVSALINEGTGKATGVVVGIVGPWGSGKSSILNLVSERLKRDHNDAVVVRFDPWLVSGRNDLISAFLAELLGTISSGRRRFTKLRSFAKTASKYGQQLAPAIPVLGTAIGSGLGALGTGLEAAESLGALRTRLFRELKEASVPIVVLIDEIDRVEDGEIRTVAQLVRAVADFPGISYLLAYDPERVAQALGHGAPPGQEYERGRSYLEKIVQLQIPLPVTLDEELTELITAELAKLADELGLPPSFSANDRYQALLRMVSGDCIATLRDVNRLVGTYHALGSMLRGEVDWLDLLAYSILSIKAPGIVKAIRRDPWAFSGNTVSLRNVSRQMELSRLSLPDRFKALLPDAENTEVNRNILGFLFPIYTDAATRRYAGEHLDALHSRRPLLTTLRLGLLPRAYPRGAVEQFIRSSSEEVTAKLNAAFSDGTIDDFVDRVDDLYPEVEGVDHVQFWQGVATFARKPDCEWMSFYQSMQSVIGSLASVLESAVRRDAKAFVPIAEKVFTNLRESEEDELTAYWLRSHIFSFGLFRMKQSGSEHHRFLTEAQTESVARGMSMALRPLHLAGRLIPCRWDLQPVYTMIDAGAWDDVCRSWTDEALKEDRAVDGLTLMLFGNAFTTDRSLVGEICSLDNYLERVKSRLASGARRPHETVVAALEKAISGRW